MVSEGLPAVSTDESADVRQESEIVTQPEETYEQEQIVEQQPGTQTITTYTYETTIYDEKTGEIIGTPIPQNPEIIAPPPSENGFIEEVCRLVNIEREREGIAPLLLDAPLCEAAQKRAEELADPRSSDHTRPDGTMYYSIFTELNIGQLCSAENIAQGQRTPEDVVAQWMSSESHRASIMNPDYHRLGVGYFETDSAEFPCYWDQLFTN